MKNNGIRTTFGDKNRKVIEELQIAVALDVAYVVSMCVCGRTDSV